MCHSVSIFRMEIQRRLGMTGTSNTTGSANSSPRNHRRKGHRRQMSDPRISSYVSPIKEDRDVENELERVSCAYTDPSLSSLLFRRGYNIFLSPSSLQTLPSLSTGVPLTFPPPRDARTVLILTRATLSSPYCYTSRTNIVTNK